jgi:flagellar basal-body rod modification protein FlgD
MSIAAIGNDPSATQQASSPGMKGTKDEFLKLFMAQLQHQDPFAPTSGADMVAQLAQLSSVEQAKQTNDQLAAIAAAQTSQASAGLSGLVGRDCDAAAGTFQLDKGAAPPLSVESTGPMKGASVVITDADGKELRRIPIADGSTSADIQWDGKDASGKPLPQGSYQVSVDAGSTTSTINSRWHGRIDAVELTADGPRLRMGGLLLAPGDVRTIGSTHTTSTTGGLP